MIERGGKLRPIPVADEKFVILAPVMRDNIDKDALLQTDKAVVFEKVGHYLEFRGHRMINHIVSYGEGLNHTNTIENAFSLLKRGVYGTFHKVSVSTLAATAMSFLIGSIVAEYSRRCSMGR